MRAMQSILSLEGIIKKGFVYNAIFRTVDQWWIPESSSWARLRANMANSTLSNEHRSEAGRQRASMNALKHGECSDLTTTLPGEDQVELNREIETAIHDLGAVTETERELATDVALCSWRVRRGLHAEDARVTCQLYNLDAGFERV